MIGALHQGIIASSRRGVLASGFWLDAIRMSPHSSRQVTGYEGNNIRIILPASRIAKTGSKVRVTFTHGATAAKINSAFIGVRDGASLGFASAPTRLTFGGNNGQAGYASGEVVTDAVAFNVTGSADLILAFYLDYGSVSGLQSHFGYSPGASPFALYNYATGGADSSGDVSPAGTFSINTGGDLASGFTALEVLDSTALSDTDPLSTHYWGAHSGSVGWAGYSIRVVIPASALANVSTTQVRLRAAGTDAVGGAVTKCFIGEQAASGDVYDFAATPVEILSGGVSGISVSAGQEKWTDLAAFATDGTKALVISMYCATGNLPHTAMLDGKTIHYRSGDSASTVDALAHTSYSRIPLFTGIELF